MLLFNHGRDAKSVGKTVRKEEVIRIQLLFLLMFFLRF